MAPPISKPSNARILLSDINDLLTPAPSCVLQSDSSKYAAGSFVNPMFPVNKKVVKLDNGADTTLLPQPALDRNLSMNVATNTELPQTSVMVQNGGTQTSKQVARISLSDCLTCSGCVTSAETVLMDSQSHQRFAELLHNADVSIVSLSQQSVASIAAAYNLPLQVAARKLAWFLRSRLNATYVVHLSAPRNLSLMHLYREFSQRIHGYLSEQEFNTEGNRTSPLANHYNLPILVTACPGFTTFGEKMLEDEVLRLFASTVSSQSTAGALIRAVTDKNGEADYDNGLNSDDPTHFITKQMPSTSVLSKLAECSKQQSVVHCSIMPCADKKLEAARSGLKSESGLYTDMVLTTSELEQLFNEEAECSLSQYDEQALDSLLGESEEMYMTGGRNGVSGGYLDFVIRQFAYEKYGLTLLQSLESDPNIEVKTIRNQDMREIRLNVPGKSESLCFAYVYGLRNIQALVRRIRSKKCSYVFVEVMSCPEGCLSGGGQIAAKTESERLAADTAKLGPEEADVPSVGTDKKNAVERIRSRFLDAAQVSPVHDSASMQVYSQVEQESLHTKDILSTSYKMIKKTVAMDIEW